jgi:hypothetical protein
MSGHSGVRFRSRGPRATGLVGAERAKLSTSMYSGQILKVKLLGLFRIKVNYLFNAKAT